MDNKLPEIPSEFIEPYLVNFLSSMIEGVGLGITPPQTARECLRGVEWFVSRFCGLHAKLATTNQYYKFTELSDERMKEICKEIVQNHEI